MPRRASATRLVYVTVITDPSGDTKRADVEAASKLARREEERDTSSVPASKQDGREEERKRERNNELRSKDR